VSFFRENGGEYYDLGSLNCYWGRVMHHILWLSASSCLSILIKSWSFRVRQFPLSFSILCLGTEGNESKVLSKSIYFCFTAYLSWGFFPILIWVRIVLLGPIFERQYQQQFHSSGTKGRWYHHCSYELECTWASN
jgi:hypothetical protein